MFGGVHALHVKECYIITAMEKIKIRPKGTAGSNRRETSPQTRS